MTEIGVQHPEIGVQLPPKPAFNFLRYRRSTSSDKPNQIRPGEARGAKWEEIDFSAVVWSIPATRMKASRQHRVPLCARAVEILHAAARLRRDSTPVQPGGLVFPSARGKELADARLSKLLDQLGIGAVPHGFRSSFRDWVSERTNHPREVVEAALAHVVGNQTEAAYARSDLFDRRRQLMTDWMQYLDPKRSPRPIVV